MYAWLDEREVNWLVWLMLPVVPKLVMDEYDTFVLAYLQFARSSVLRLSVADEDVTLDAASPVCTGGVVSLPPPTPERCGMYTIARVELEIITHAMERVIGKVGTDGQL